MIALIFQRRVSMPEASAAHSFCLIAVSDRPKRERSIRSETSIAAISMASAISTYAR